MTAAGEVDILRNADGEATYRRCSTTEHHHHLVCRHCGTAVDIQGPAWTGGYGKSLICTVTPRSTTPSN
jgi:Fe2+ or Zn2+ uptake regulation protein